MVDLSHGLYLILLEEGYISYDDYVRRVPLYDIPPEYASVALFLKNKGKASKRIIENTSDKASHNLRLCPPGQEEPP